MKQTMQMIGRGIAFLAPVAFGYGAFVFVSSTDKEVPRVERPETARKMRVIDVERLSVLPRAEGFGLASADRTWRAIAQVGGRVVEVHPGLRSGLHLRQGALLVRIDTRDVEISITSARAEGARLAAELKQLDQEEIDNTRSLEIEQAILEVQEGEVERLKELLQNDASSRVAYEQGQRSLLGQKQAVLGIEGAIALFPFQKAITQAQLDGANASLAQVERDLEFCAIHTPFAGSVGATTVEVGQFVGAQEELFEVSSDDAIRIDAAIPEDRVFRLLGAAERETITKMVVDPSEEARKLVEGLFEARVSAKIGDLVREWPARVVGVRESLDEQTKALRMTVVVDRQDGGGLSEAGPPLSPGTFCRVEIRSSARQAIVIPRSALRGGDVFWLDAESRLRRKTLDVDFHQGEITVVRDGLKAGMQVVVSDTTPAIEGQLIAPVVDAELAAAVAREASGDGEVD